MQIKGENTSAVPPCFGSIKSPYQDTNISLTRYAGPASAHFNAALGGPYYSALPARLTPSLALWKESSDFFPLQQFSLL